MECQKEKNLKTCPCTYPGCPRKGICCECIKYHLENDELSACCFSKEAEKTYDRSIKKFIEEHKTNNN
ncbi:MAG TPA: DUF6485 family protein [Candidatus Paceibacterota bacterium]|nr:DUF6485 family protein [Candidatus Paceibacterota bacterium]